MDVETVVEKEEERPKLKRVMSGMLGLGTGVGMGRRDVWRPMGMRWNLAIKAQPPPAKDGDSFPSESDGDEM